jgi:hypothetical protein
MISLFRKLKWLTQRRSKEAELRDELQFHLDEEAEARRGEGRGWSQLGGLLAATWETSR